jgi:micrococcal nuclease
MYIYNAELIRVIDGDTIEAMVDLGFYMWHKVTVRLYGINAPESRTKDLQEKERGLAAKARLTELLKDGKFLLESQGIGKYGRCLGYIYLQEDDTEVSVNSRLIEEGHAELYEE